MPLNGASNSGEDLPVSGVVFIETSWQPESTEAGADVPPAPEIAAQDLHPLPIEESGATVYRRLTEKAFVYYEPVLRKINGQWGLQAALSRESYRDCIPETPFPSHSQPTSPYMTRARLSSALISFPFGPAACSSTSEQMSLNTLFSSSCNSSAGAAHSCALAESFYLKRPRGWRNGSLVVILKKYHILFRSQSQIYHSHKAILSSERFFIAVGWPTTGRVCLGLPKPIPADTCAFMSKSASGSCACSGVLAHVHNSENWVCQASEVQILHH